MSPPLVRLVTKVRRNIRNGIQFPLGNLPMLLFLIGICILRVHHSQCCASRSYCDLLHARLHDSTPPGLERAGSSSISIDPTVDRSRSRIDRAICAVASLGDPGDPGRYRGLGRIVTSGASRVLVDLVDLAVPYVPTI